MSLLDGARLLHRIEILAAISAPGPGVTRLAYSDEDAEARELVAGWMREAGLFVTVDPVGNVVGRSVGDANLGLLGLGSHLDSVVEAGALDGAYGVVAAIEVAAALQGRVKPSGKGIVVVAFSNEEGARGSLPMIGSLAFIGQLDRGTLDEPDDEGVSVATRLRAHGGRPDEVRLGSMTAPPGLDAFLELHIEQGPILEAEGVELGVVEVITGRTSLEVVLVGRSSHAGTTPMNRRADALVAAARLIVAVENLARSGTVPVATVGYLDAAPNMRNVIPGLVTLAVDLRDTDKARLERTVDIVGAAAAEIGAETGVAIKVRTTSVVEPTRTDPGICDAFQDAARKQHASVITMASGAGHDAQIVARAVPIGLLFVPSEDGISHSPLEHTRAEDLVRGADVLMQTCVELLELIGE